MRGCPCIAYPKGTWFKDEMDSRGDCTPRAELRPGLPSIVWMIHSADCRIKRQEIPELTEVVAWGPDYADGEFWRWKEEEPPPTVRSPPRDNPLFALLRRMRSL